MGTVTKTEWDTLETVINNGTIADASTSERASGKDNHTEPYVGCIWVVSFTGSGNDADGVAVYLRGSLDNSVFADAETYYLGTCPSPNSATKTRMYYCLMLPPYYKEGIKNDSGASITSVYLYAMRFRWQK